MTHTLTIDEHVSLQAYNTLAIPAKSRWFCSIKNKEELLQAVFFTQQQACPLLILGGGSNIVLADHFTGLTIKMDTLGLYVERETDTHVHLSAAAGESWHNTVMHCVNNDWYGVENLALIPGSVGAAPIQNIGAYGVELEQCFDYLEALELSTGKICRFTAKDCEFAYRDSIFKQRLKNQYIITRVVLVLSKKPSWNLDYPALKDKLSGFSYDYLTAKQVSDAVIDIRRSKLPDPKDVPNAGSFFKNPIVTVEQFEKIKSHYPNVVAYPYGDRTRYFKLAAGWLLDNAGWKGKLVDGFAMHKDQALVLTNPNQLNGQLLLEFVDEVRNDIYKKYGVLLEIEPIILDKASI